MNAATSFYSDGELLSLGLGSCGRHVRISRFARLYNPGQIHLGSNVRIDDFSIVTANQPVRLGDYVHVAAYAAIFGSEGVTLHDFSGLSTRVSIYTVSDDYTGMTLTNPTVPDEFRPKMDRGPVMLGRHSIIGAHSIVMPGLTLGEGVAVGALSFVTKNCEEWSIYFGAPARKVGPRRRDLLELEAKLKMAQAAT